MPPKLDPRIAATRNRLERLLRTSAETYAPDKPVVDLKGGRHILVLSLGKGKDFYSIGRWLLKCIANNCCTLFDFITPKLTAPQLHILERIWVAYHRTGRKYGIASPAPYLLASVAPVPPPLVSTPVPPAPLVPGTLPQPSRSKRARGADDTPETPNKVARCDLATRSSSSVTRRPIIDLTRQSGHRVVIDLTPLDSDSDDAASVPALKPIELCSKKQKLARKSNDRVRMASMQHIGTFDLE